jgi:hypothetical protein
MKLDLKLCTPAIVYLVLAILGTLSDFSQKSKFNLGKFLMNLVIIAILTYGLNYVCKKYSTRASWYTLAALIFLPLLLAMTFFMSRNMIR